MTSPTLTYDREANALYILEVLHAEPEVLSSIPTLPDSAAFRDLVKPRAS